MNDILGYLPGMTGRVILLNKTDTLYFVVLAGQTKQFVLPNRGRDFS
jgi:hypothetical protein